MLTFHEYVRMQETLLMRLTGNGSCQINPMPITNARCSHLKRNRCRSPTRSSPRSRPSLKSSPKP